MANYDALVEQIAARNGVDPQTLRRFIQIESGGDPTNTTGSYKGLLQLSENEFRKHGGQGSIYDPEQNLSAGASKLASESATFAQKYGRAPTAAELYMIHQQGWGGFQAHMDNPDQPAWMSMAATGEGRAKGEKWAKLAISGNMPETWRKEVSPDAITSREFLARWNSKVDNKPAKAEMVAALRADPTQQPSAPMPPADRGALVASAAPVAPPVLPVAQAETPDTKPTPAQLAEALRAFGGAMQPRATNATPLQTSFKQFSSLLKA